MHFSESLLASILALLTMIASVHIASASDSSAAKMGLSTREAAVSQAITVIGLPAETKAASVDSVTATAPAKAEDSMSTAYVIGLHAGKTIWRVRFDSVGANGWYDITALLEAESRLPVLVICSRRTGSKDIVAKVFDTAQVVREHEEYTSWPTGLPALTFLEAMDSKSLVSPGEASFITAEYVHLRCNDLEGLMTLSKPIDEAWMVQLQGIPGSPLDEPDYPPTTSWWFAVDETRILWNMNIPCSKAAGMRPGDRK
jgi:hypothetical protein